MGVWDKVEAAGFPIKLGATCRWGSSNELWDFSFLTERGLRNTKKPTLQQGTQINRTRTHPARLLYHEFP